MRHQCNTGRGYTYYFCHQYNIISLKKVRKPNNSISNYISKDIQRPVTTSINEGGVWRHTKSTFTRTAYLAPARGMRLQSPWEKTPAGAGAGGIEGGGSPDLCRARGYHLGQGKVKSSGQEFRSRVQGKVRGKTKKRLELFSEGRSKVSPMLENIKRWGKER